MPPGPADFEVNSRRVIFRDLLWNWLKAISVQRTLESKGQLANTRIKKEGRTASIRKADAVRERLAEPLLP
jgi:hypothetical protein